MTQYGGTYTVEVITDNSSGRFPPYLTANVKFEVTRREDVLTVPNAALRWSPPTEMIAPEARAEMANADQQSASRGQAGGATSRPAGRSTTRPSGNRPMGAAAMRRGTLWVKEGEFVKPIRVRTGITDQIVTEVQGEG